MINKKRKSDLKKTQEMLTVDTGTVCYVVQYLWIAFYFYSHSKAQYVSPLIFNEPRTSGNESKNVDLKNVPLKTAQTINLFY